MDAATGWTSGAAACHEIFTPPGDETAWPLAWPLRGRNAAAEH